MANNVRFLDQVSVGAFGDIGSNAVSASYAETASFAEFATSASYAVSASHEITKEVSSSHADTASFAQSGNGIFSGSFSGSFEGNIPSSTSSSYAATASFAQSGNGIFSGSFSGSFEGNGSGLTNIPASGITGLNLSQISSGSATASISPNGGLYVNTNITSSGNISAVSMSGDGSQLTNIVSSSYSTTSSYAFDAISSSYALTASYAVSASHEIIKEVSSSYADTASFAQSGDGIFSGSFSGSFEGNGSGLTDIPAAGIVGLNLSQIVSGSATASISPNKGFQINTDTRITGSLRSLGSLTVGSNTAEFPLFFPASYTGSEWGNIIHGNNNGNRGKYSLTSGATNGFGARIGGDSTTPNPVTGSQAFGGGQVIGVPNTPTFSAFAANNGVAYSGSSFAINEGSAYSNFSFAAGSDTKAYGKGSAAFGWRTEAGNFYDQLSSGQYTMAIGVESKAFGNYSFAQGSGSIASGSSQAALGWYNTYGNDTSIAIIGNGTNDLNRSDLALFNPTEIIFNQPLTVSSNISSSGFISASYFTGDGSQLTNIVSSSYSTTSSYAFNALSSSYALTASYAVSASHEIIKEVSSSYADTASFAQSGDGIFSGSFSGSFEGDGSEITGVISSSYSTTSSYTFNALSSSYSTTSSYAFDAISSSYALTASYAVSASHEIIKEVSSSYADTASFAQSGDGIFSGSFSGSFEGISNTASYALTASYVETAQTASYVLNSVSSSFSSFAISASYAVSASHEIIKEVSSSYADTASFAQSGNGIFSGSFSGSYVGDGSGLTGVDPFPFSGSAVITGSLLVSGSSLPLEIIGSGSTVFSVQGSLGELFAIDDVLSGSLLVVNDISGLPQFEVFSDGRTLIGAIPRSLYTTATINATTAATSESIYSLSTSSYDGEC
jgi:hypothetical protein